VKAEWIPGKNSWLAVVTALDAISPQYYYLLPSGKVLVTRTLTLIDCFITYHRHENLLQN